MPSVLSANPPLPLEAALTSDLKLCHDPPLMTFKIPVSGPEGFFEGAFL